MDTTLLFQYFALFLVACLTLKHTILHRLKKLPPSPPFSLPIIGHLYLLKQPIHRALAKLAACYGPVLYLQLGNRPTLLVSSPSAVEECLIRNDVFHDRPQLLTPKHTMFNYPIIPWAPQGPIWRHLRKISTVEILSPQRLQILSGVRADVARTFISRTMKKCQNGVPIEMKSALFGLTLDNMMRMLVGKSSYEESYNKIDQEKNNSIGVERYKEIVEESFRRNGITNMEDFLPILKWFRMLFGMKSTEERIMKLNGEKEEFMRGLMEQHRKMDSEGTLTDAQKKSMLQVLLSSQKMDPQHYSDDMIGSLLLTLLQGGTDTSASTIVWVLSLLLNNPEVLHKAQEEMDKIIGDERLVEESDRNKLPYIQCIINETFRMYPTGPLASPYESKVDCIIENYHIPRGSMMIYNIWAIHYDPKIWADPMKFKPERFLESLEGVTTKSRYKLLPFGVGKRSCPGEHLANRVVWLAVAILIQCFDWERVGDELVDLKECVGLTLVKMEPLLVKCRPRPCMMNLLSQL